MSAPGATQRAAMQRAMDVLVQSIPLLPGVNDPGLLVVKQDALRAIDELRDALAQTAEQAEPVAQTSAEWERRFLAYDPKVDPAEAQCDIPPHGWRCTRAKGHDGPCAAVAAPDDVALVRRSMARLAAAEQAEPAVGFRLLPSRLTNEMRAAMADAARAYMARTGGNSPDAMYDAAVAAAPPAPAPSAPSGEQAGPVPSIVADVLAELAKAVAKFPTWPTDPLHALAVLGEEFGELTKDVLQLCYEPHKTTPESARKEAMQTAAMALRFAISLGRYEYRPGQQHAQGEA